MDQLNILILDDEEIIQKGLTEYLKEQGFNVFNAYRPSQAFEIIQNSTMDIILLDVNLPEMNGIEVLKKIKKSCKDIEIIMITGHADLEIIMQSMKFGAFDYFYKPISLIEIKSSIERTSKYVSLHNELNQLKDFYTLLNDEYFKKVGGEIIGKSKVIKEVLTLTLKAAEANETSVLITGPSGCGKELIARTIHYFSDRKDAYFNPVNCTAIPESLIEGEFFGHVKGAFTGAIEDKKGCFEIANKGTLFIDEIGDMPLAAQGKLLRVLQDQKIKKIGANQEVSIDTRIITATNKNLKQMVEENKFRLDLFYRLNTLEINLPSLEERKEDIPLLFEHYISKFSTDMNKKIDTIGDDVFEMLSNYHFPGNIRELKNLAERALILCEGNTIKLQHFPVDIFHYPESDTVEADQNDLSFIERNKIGEVLKETNHNISQSAKKLGLSRPALYRKIKKYNIH
ncbi:MAG: sigma-54-dependent Fis family transcriptional regulator [Deltaproteobacteria bacterium]|jgi:DNA-binding NtrC family response regulator|nr:sigma-54-dependent Fis family transcriptional regulator [Deltaproteobacteria bacterium]